MMRSLSSAVAGLRAHQTKMDVIGNNIANVNTYGFKSSRTTFADVYYQNIAAAAAPSGAKGGTNPTQIGYGAAVATIDVLNTQSGAASTDRALDVYITGDGYLAAKDANGNLKYTRLGILGFDANGNLIDSKGNFVMGFEMDTSQTPAVPRVPANGKLEDASALREIRVAPELLDQLTGISISPSGAIVGVLPGETEGKFAAALPTGVSDPKLAENTNYSGNLNLQITATFAGTSALFSASPTVSEKAKFANGSYDYTVSGSAGNWIVTLEQGGVSYKAQVTETSLDGQTLTFRNNDGEVVLTGTAATGLTTGSTGQINAGAYYAFLNTTDKGGNVVREPETGFALPDASTTPVTLGEVTLTINTGATGFGAFNGSIGSASTGTGEQINIGNLAIAKFRNNAGMEEVGDSYFAETANSGAPVFVRPGLEGTGSLKASYLEMSNVDISKEFTEMITTQRGFQANTRIVTVSDEMLQELVNLKR